MCLLVFAWRSHPDYPLILVGNRDEFYTRRTRPAAWWGQAVSLLAGHDEEAGGTWLGVTRRGRFAALTNVRAPTERNPHAPSRGALVLSALQAPQRGGDWLEAHAPKTSTYNGFNLLVGDVLPHDGDAEASALHYYSNRLEQPAQSLAPGIYGLSNGFLDTPWPKVTRAVGAFACEIACRGRARTAGPADGAARRGARLRTPRDRRAARLGTRVVGDPDPRQWLRHAHDERAHGPQRRAGDFLRAHLRPRRPGSAGPTGTSSSWSTTKRGRRCAPGRPTRTDQRGRGGVPRSHAMSTCGIPQSMYSPPTTA